MKKIRGYDDVTPEHREAVLSAVRNVGAEHLVDPEADTAPAMFYKVWCCYTADTDMTETEAEEMLVAEVNAAIDRLEN